MKHLLTALFLCSVATIAHAEISQKLGNLDVHYNALTTDELQPDVARTYKIERSKTRGMVTMSVLQKNKMGVPTPVPAKVTVYATNMTQQLSNITMREVKEGPAIYYIGEFRVAPPDTLKFNATIEVAGEPKYGMTFDQKFFK